MALYNQITFGLLVFEIVVFIVLIIPLPFTWRRALFKAVAESKLVAKALFALKISFIFVALLFVDAVRAPKNLSQFCHRLIETGTGQPHARQCRHSGCLSTQPNGRNSPTAADTLLCILRFRVCTKLEKKIQREGQLSKET